MICRLAFAFTVAFLTPAVARAAESFASLAEGPFASLESSVGTWSAVERRAVIHPGRARAGRPHDGRQGLRLLGGDGCAVDLTLHTPLDRDTIIVFRAERWTADDPCAFTVEAADADGEYRPVLDCGGLRVDTVPTPVAAPLPAGTARVRFRATTPPDRGVFIDDVALVPDGPMRLAGIDVVQPVTPALAGRTRNPVLGIRVRTTGSRKPLSVEGITLSLADTTRCADVAQVAVFRGGPEPGDPLGEQIGAAVPSDGPAVFAIRGDVTLVPGDDWFWVTVSLHGTADIDGLVDAAVTGVRISGSDVAVADGGPPGAQRIGVVVRGRGEDGSDVYRIPGLVRTNAGSLVASYDVRYRGAPDLPADIDVGISRSTDGGRTWEPMRVVLDMGRDPAFAFDGVGDPCVFVDRGTGRIHVAAVWSHGARAWKGSGPGLSPDETGQLVMAWSDDDGRTWSQPRNLTRELKDPAWRYLLAGPGAGITTRDGTLVFPAQFKDATDVPHSTLVWSKDHGSTWNIGTGAAPDTTEAQVAELADGALMLNCRGDRRARIVAVTHDLGATWKRHAGDHAVLPESGCMASLLALDDSDAGRRLLFSNPAVTSGRHSMTVKVSADEGRTWPAALAMLYDVRPGFGYSCLAPVDDGRVGVLYEGLGELYFLRLSAAESRAGPWAADQQGRVCPDP